MEQFKKDFIRDSLKQVIIHLKDFAHDEENIAQFRTEVLTPVTRKLVHTLKWPLMLIMVSLLLLTFGLCFLMYQVSALRKQMTFK